MLFYENSQTIYTILTYCSKKSNKFLHITEPDFLRLKNLWTKISSISRISKFKDKSTYILIKSYLENNIFYLFMSWNPYYNIFAILFWSTVHRIFKIYS